MRVQFVVPLLLAAALATPFSAAEPSDESTVLTAAAEDSCSAGPPCGPITVIITIVLEKSKEIKFGDAEVFETKGKVSYYFDVNDEGYWYDSTEDIWIEFGINKQPPWLKTSFEPQKVKVPYRPSDGCTTCVTQEGSDAQQWQFYWEHDVKVKVDKLRDPTPEELKKWLKSDGMYRVSFRASSNDSMAGTDATGRPAGLMEGYGPKDLRFRPEIDMGSSGGDEPDAFAPNLGILGLVVAIAAAVAIRLRRE